MCCCGWAEPAKSCSTERPICSRRTPLQVIHAEADCLWLSSVDDVAVGDLVSQLHCAGHKQDLERAFVDAWKQRWDRHRDVSPDHWPVMTDFARAHMPRLQLDWPSLWLLTLSILHLCPKNAQELHCRCEKSSPQCVGESVLHVSWCRSHWGVAIPAPWMRLTALQRLISLNRPWITDQSRCRGLCTEFGVRTMRRKPYVLLTPSCLTRYMVGVLPASQARFGVNFCGLLKIQVEGIALTGLIADLPKAFNHIPRLIVFEALALLGIPWSCLPHGLGRCQGRAAGSSWGQTSRPLSTVSRVYLKGMDCPAWVCLLWISSFPMCQPISYVGSLPPRRTWWMASFQCLTKFVDAMDLLLDAKETFSWSVCSGG